MPLDPVLWKKIAAVQFDAPGAELTFTARLARENRWSREFAERAVQEYRRFAYLAVTAGHEVTPSDEIDQVWHLHLTYTRHYWETFCKALGAPLHHGPTSGGALEKSRYENNYAATLASYKAAFGAEPPADIWPPATIRFGKAPFMARVNIADSILLPRKLVHRTAGVIAFAGVGMVGLAAAAAPPARSFWQTLQTMPLLIWGVLAIIAALVVLAVSGATSRKEKSGGANGVGASSGGKSSDGNGGSGCAGDGCGAGCGSG